MQRYCGIVSAETIFGTNFFRDFAAHFRDFFGGRSRSYEDVLRQAKDAALQEMNRKALVMGANAVEGIKLDFETVGPDGSMMMVVASGTAVVI